MNNDKLNFEVSEEVKALIPEEKLSSIVERFTQLDSNQDGKISIEEYLNFALAKEKALLLKKFESIDTDKDGYLNFEEFTIASEPIFNILKKFRELDIDNNGLLSFEEVISIAESLVLPLSIDQIKAIIQQVDGDGDGQISYYEYLGAITHIGFQ